MDAAILPVKRLDRAKQRLAPHFDKPTRIEIARAMLADAFKLAGAADFLTWWVVSDDGDVLASARAHDFHTVQDPGEGLNRALAHAVAAAISAGSHSAIFVPVDVPLARRSDLLDLVDTGETSEIVVVPSRADGGTNALSLRPADVITPRFGPGSLQAHMRAADDNGLPCSILALTRLALDIDTIDDVDECLHASGESNTLRLLRRLRAR